MTLDSPTLNGTKISTEKGEGGRGKSNRIIFTDFTSDLHHIGTVPRRQINDRQLTFSYDNKHDYWIIKQRRIYVHHLFPSTWGVHTRTHYQGL